MPTTYRIVGLDVWGNARDGEEIRAMLEALRPEED